MRKLLLLTLFTVAMFASGCAFLDSLLLEPLRDPEGNQQYVDLTATAMLPKSDREAGLVVLVDEADMVPGHEYEIAYSDDPSATLGTVGSVLGSIPGWGGLAALVAGAAGSFYATIRGKKKLVAATALSNKWAGVAKHGIKVIEAIKNHPWDTDSDGKIELEEIEDGIVLIVRALGKDAADPEFLSDVVRALTGSFEESERQKLLESIAAKV